MVSAISIKFDDSSSITIDCLIDDWFRAASDLPGSVIGSFESARDFAVGRADLTAVECCVKVPIVGIAKGLTYLGYGDSVVCPHVVEVVKAS